MKAYLLILFVLFANSTFSQDREYVLLIHGGAGAMNGLEEKKDISNLYYNSLDTALMIGHKILEKGGDGKDVVMAVISYLEDCPLFNAGKGATCTDEGSFELDASIMCGNDLSAGAVAGVKTVKHPIMLANATREKSPHVMLSGRGAEQFAQEQNLESVDNMFFATPKTMEWVEKLKTENKKNGTVGCVVLDKKGNLTAGTSTGGMFRKKYGRIGDSPIIGAGTYADNNSCAVSCTGHGEYFIRHVVAFNLCARYKFLNESVEEAGDYIINKELNVNAGNGGLIVVDKNGNFSMPFNTSGMFRGYLYKTKGKSDIEKGVGIEKKIKQL